GNKSAVRRVVSFGVIAGEANDRELVHGVHLRSPFFCCPLFRGQPDRKRPRSQSKTECFVGGTGVQVSQT
ncbi:MAG: hypothetical protein ACRD7E_00075, partial [Bryobacteraceae bacterium]